MTVTDIFAISAAVLGTLGGGAVIVFALSNWLGKIWASRILASQKHYFDKELELIRAQLRMQESQREVRFTKLHEERLECIKNLHSILRNLEGTVNSVSLLYDIHKGDPNRDPYSRDQAQEIRKMAMNFLNFYRSNKLFFSDSLCDSFDRLCWESGLFGQNYLFYVVDGSDNDITKEHEMKEWFRVKKELPGIIKDVEREFKELLGVEEPRMTGEETQPKTNKGRPNLYMAFGCQEKNLP